MIHVLTPPSSHAAVALEALERGCHVLVEKPSPRARRTPAASASWRDSKGLVATREPLAAVRPAGAARARAGARGRARRGRRRRHLPRLGVPALRGRPAAAAVPRRRLPVARPRRALPLPDPGAARDRSTTSTPSGASLGGDPNLAFDEWRALVRCERGLGQFQLSWNTKPMQSQIIIHGTRGVLRVDLFAMFRGRRSVDAAAEGGRARRQRVTEIAPAARSTCPRSRGSSCARRSRRIQGCATSSPTSTGGSAPGEPPPVSIEDAAVIVEWVEKVARAAEAEHAAELARFAPAADG